MTCSRSEDLPPRRRLSWKDQRSDFLNSDGSGSGRGPLPDFGNSKAFMNSADSRRAHIDDRRAVPCEADHRKIMKSFQQDMANVDEVIVYDHHTGAYAELEDPSEASSHGAARL